MQTTMREANDRGFDCLLVSDATASYTPAFKKATLEMVVSQVRSSAVYMLHPSCWTMLHCSACNCWRTSAALQLRIADLRPQAASKPSCPAHAPAMSKQGVAEIRHATCQCRVASWAGRLMPLLLLMRWHSDGRDLHWEHEDTTSARICRPRICIEVFMDAFVLSASILLHMLFSLTSAPASQHDGATNAPVALEMLAHQLDLLRYYCSFRLFRPGCNRDRVCTVTCAAVLNHNVSEPGSGVLLDACSPCVPPIDEMYIRRCRQRNSTSTVDSGWQRQGCMIHPHGYIRCNEDCQQGSHETILV